MNAIFLYRFIWMIFDSLLHLKLYVELYKLFYFSRLEINQGFALIFDFYLFLKWHNVNKL